MVQRAVVTQICRACGHPERSKLAMEQHKAEFHGTPEDPIVWLTRAEDQREFTPCLSQTRWGTDLR